jgi:hypothetical protein
VQRGARAVVIEECGRVFERLGVCRIGNVIHIEITVRYNNNPRGSIYSMILVIGTYSREM